MKSIIFVVIFSTLLFSIFGEETLAKRIVCRTTPTPKLNVFKRKCGEQAETEVTLPRGHIPPIHELVFGVTYLECEEEVTGLCTQFKCCQVSLNKDGKTVTKSNCQIKGEKFCKVPEPVVKPVQQTCKKSPTSINSNCSDRHHPALHKKPMCKKNTFIYSNCNEHHHINHPKKKIIVLKHVVKKMDVIVMEKENVFVNLFMIVILVL